MSVDIDTHAPVKISEGNRRLLILADFLDQLPPERFNYEKWVGLDWKGAPDLSCGTTGCAMGWAPSIPEFAALGLELRIAHTATEVADYRLSHVPLNCVVVCPPLGVDFDPTNEVERDDPDHTTLEAAQQFFALEAEATRGLFVPEHYLPGVGYSPFRHATAQEVANHIRKYVDFRETP